MQIKDLILGAELAERAKDRDEYLKKQAEAQSGEGRHWSRPCASWLDP